MSTRIDFAAIAARALDEAEQLVPAWLPDGRRAGHEWEALNPTRVDGRIGSFKVNLSTGAWSDFACDDKGGDLISLYAYLFYRSDQGAAVRSLASTLGLKPPDGAAQTSLPAQPGASRQSDKSLTKTLLPVPSDASPPPSAHKFRGWPVATWTYRDAAGLVLGYTCRFTTSDGGKEILPLTYIEEAGGAREWRWKAFDTPRPLYGLERLLPPERPVLIVEGEKCADAAQAAMPGYAVLSWPGGSKAVGKADLRPLTGRRCLLWPDCDAQLDKAGQLLPAANQPGMQAMQRLAELLTDLQCLVEIIEIPPPGAKPAGWDVADAIAEGMTGDTLQAWIEQRARVFSRAQPATPVSVTSSAVTEEDDWRKKLLYRRNECVACLFNIQLILTNTTTWSGVIAFDEFTSMTEKKRPPPWHGASIGEWEDSDDVNTAMWLTRNFGMTPSAKMVTEVVECVARAHGYHPVRDWLLALPPWDGTPRLGDWLSDWVGVDKTEYTQMVGRFFLIGMVARVMGPRPGDRVIAGGKRRNLVKFDYCLVLEGKQGRYKSTVLAVLGGDWFGDTDLDLNSKDSMSALRGKWVYEFAELGSISRAESSRHKSFLSRPMDEFRPAFGRREIRLPRQCVFGGTVNGWEWHKDPTGGRRFWPVECVREIDIDSLHAARPQLFAEALALYSAGTRFWPTEDEQASIFDPQQLKIEQHESLIDALHDWVHARALAFSIADAVRDGLSLDASKLTRDMQTRVGVALRKLGCRRVERRNGMVRYWYEPPDKSAVSSEASLEDDSRVPF